MNSLVFLRKGVKALRVAIENFDDAKLRKQEARFMRFLNLYGVGLGKIQPGDMVHTMKMIWVDIQAIGRKIIPGLEISISFNRQSDDDIFF